MKTFKTTLWTSAGALVLTALLFVAPANADQVILDDLIVDGSACIGMDCVNGESFGFDTIRIKENNLRIRAVDTSSTSSFPSRDWQITFNDSSNGGANKFSIDDIDAGRTPFTIEGNAPSHSLYVDDGGRIGFGTSTPVVDLHVKTGNTPTLRLEQDGSSGFTPQIWDVAGNEANFFIRDVSNGSTLAFRIRPGAPTSAIDVAASGNVGIGTSSPDFDIDVEKTSGSANFVVRGQDSGSMILQDIGTTDSAAQYLVNNGSVQIRGLNQALGAETVPGISINLSDGDTGIGCTGSTFDLTVQPGDVPGACNSGTFSRMNAGDTQFSVSSSRSLKENLAEVERKDILDKIAEVNVYTYDFISGPENKLGLMAEDFHQVFARGSDKELNGTEVQMALWLAVQELTVQNQQLAEKLAAMEASEK